MAFRTVVAVWAFIACGLDLVHSQTTVRYCGNTPADVVFLLDSSNSMWGPDFDHQLEFVSNVVEMFDIGENTTQVGLATFNNDVQLQFYLSEYRNKERLQRAIRMVQQSYGMSTATDRAIRFLRTRFFNPRYGSRPDVPHIAVVMTDGQSDQMLKTLIEATKAKRHNIFIFTIGIGKEINSVELERMASAPSVEYAFVVDTFSFLDSIREKLAIKTCLVTTPPTTPSTTMVPTPPLARSTTSTRRPTTAATTRSTTTPTAEDTTTTTSTIFTTTSIQQSTTTSWLDAVRKVCDKKPVDVVFALDSSDEIGPKDFWYQVKFVRDFTLGLDIGLNKTRIGVVLYSDQVVHGFDVNDHFSLTSAIGDLYNIQRTYGGARIDRVIHHVRTKSFRRTVSRRESAQLLVLIAASSQKSYQSAQKEAAKAKNTGINILVVGVGDRVNQDELETISGVETQKSPKLLDFFMDVGSHRRRAMFHSESFSDLENVVMHVTVEACSAEVAAVPVSDQACGTRQEADVMFVMDSESAGKKNTKKSLDFIKHVAGAVDVSADTVQIGMIQPEDCIPYLESFRLNSHGDKDHVLSALESGKEGDKLSSLMKNMRKDAFKKKKGGRKGAKKVAVVLVDGEIERPLKVLKEARRAQVHGIEVYVILVGRYPPQQEVMDMCSYPPGKHFFQLPDYDKLKELEDSLIELLCDEL